LHTAERVETFIESHNWALVAVSFGVSVVGAHVSLLMADFIVGKKDQLDYRWLALASTVFGACAIWAMHFIGILAYDMSMPVTFDIRQTLLSAALPVLLCFTAFWTVFQFRGNIMPWLLSGLLFGLGIAAMHYMGMDAMNMHATMRHDSHIFYLSIAIAIVAATIALRIFVHWKGLRRTISPLLMAISVCGMHYTAMFGMSMEPVNHGMNAQPLSEGAVSADFMRFAAGLVVFLTIVVGGGLVVFRKLLDREPRVRSS
jgi:NO-binding membrane sensor protein with MHYT domain